MARMLAAEAAQYIGITEDELMMSRARGLPPGTLGSRVAPGQPVTWDSEDLLPAPDAVPQPVCEQCGFVAASPRGLATHERRH
jgi:hypothetical protein